MNTSGTRVVAALAAIAALVAACSSAPRVGSVSPGDPTSAPSSAEGVASAAIPSGFPLGSWKTVITAADLGAGGITGEGDIGENTGEFTMTMSPDGTWSTAQVSEVPLRWPVFKGTWAATGSNGFTQVTTFPQDYAGDSVDFTWKLEDGSLLLKVVDWPDPILPIIMETHPWQRVG